ncbi:MAG: hypothetical protein C5B58_09350 [Acidobacteria bacterium]|nr:MAG: hypothetical protein C5B58_09350 [Acidobacteriota bacterium]
MRPVRPVRPREPKAPWAFAPAKQGVAGPEYSGPVFLVNSLFTFPSRLFPRRRRLASLVKKWLRSVWRLFRVKKRTADELARRLDVSLAELLDWTPSYRETIISKKRGGTRRLLIPDAKLKALQRRILHKVLRRLRVHPAAKGFERGQSIVDNAGPHVGRSVVIKMDIVDFFPSCKAEEVTAYFRKIGWDEAAGVILTKLCTHEGRLPQGAPTSPRLSNLINWPLDARIARWVAYRKGAYTRYADDITISFPKDYPRKVRGVIQQVRRAARKLGFQIHEQGKLRILRHHQQQRVTGLVVNEKLNLPRRLRRLLRAVVHHLQTGKPASMTAEQLAGWQALANMVAKGAAKYPAPASPKSPGKP